jgi:hypothetical protein
MTLRPVFGYTLPVAGVSRQTRRECQHHAQPPTWRARVSLSGNSGPHQQLRCGGTVIEFTGICKLPHSSCQQQTEYRSSKYGKGWGEMYNKNPLVSDVRRIQSITLDIRCSIVSSASVRTSKRKQAPSTNDHTRYSNAQLFLQPRLLSQREQKLPLQSISLDIRYAAVSSASARTSKIISFLYNRKSSIFDAQLFLQPHLLPQR